MYCPNCNKEFDGKFCPECGTKLIEKPSAGGFNLNFGDANAISGGINLHDSHNVQNVDNSVHNITNTSNVVNNIVERQKTASEELQDKKIQFNMLLDEVFADNVLTEEEKLMVKNLQHQLGLDDVTAQALIDNARRRAHTNTRQESLGAAAGPVKQLTMLFLTNQTDRIKTMIPRMAVFARNFKVDEVQHKYYVALAAMNPEELIRLYETDLSDNYWRSYWAYIAYRKLGQNDKAEDILWGVLPNFTTYSEENTCLLQCVGEIADFGIDTAAETLNTVTGNYSPELKLFANALYMQLNPEMAAGLGATEENTAFYCQNILLEEEKQVWNEEAVDDILEQHKGKYMLFDFSGKLLSNNEYDEVEDFSEGLACVKKDGKYGFIDQTGCEVILCKYECVYQFFDGLCRIMKNHKYGFIDQMGCEVIPCIYDETYHFNDGLCKIAKNEKYGFIDKSGSEVIPCIYDDAYDFSDGLCWVEKDRNYYFIDKSGNKVLPCTYDDKGDFCEGLVCVENWDNGLKYGYKDKSGHVVIPFRFDDAGEFSEGLASVKLDEKYGFIDKFGREVIPCRYDEAYDFSEGLAKVMMNDKYGWIDKTGREVIPCNYDEAEDFCDGIVGVTNEEDGRDVIMDTKGKEIISFSSEYSYGCLGQGFIALMKEVDADSDDDDLL